MVSNKDNFILTRSCSLPIVFVAIRDPAEARLRHVDDSLSLLPFLDACIAKQAEISPRAGTLKARVIDIGSGGGLPGMIIAIARPDWEVVLLDSLRKRCDFMVKAAGEVGVSNVSVVWRRAEEAGRDSELRERFDLVIARAVAELRILSELCLPFVTCGGHWVAPKGSDPNDEVVAARNVISMLGGELIDVQPTASLTSDGNYRTAVVVRKIKTTPEKFPRRPGIPNKRPLN